jgi:hypothetical protein
VSEQDAARFIANNTTDRRASKFTPGNPNYEPFPCALCGKDIRIPGKPHGDGNHYAIHTSAIDGKPVLNPAPFLSKKNPKEKGRG